MPQLMRELLSTWRELDRRTAELTSADPAYRPGMALLDEVAATYDRLHDGWPHEPSDTEEVKLLLARASGVLDAPRSPALTLTDSGS